MNMLMSLWLITLHQIIDNDKKLPNLQITNTNDFCMCRTQCVIIHNVVMKESGDGWGQAQHERLWFWGD